MYKIFVKRFLQISIGSIIFILGINFIVDPMGIYRKNTFQRQHIENKAYPELITLKLYSKYDTAIIGTSRSQNIDHRYLSKYKIEAKNLSVAGSSIDINYELIKKAKDLNKNIILFLDPYTLDVNYNKSDDKKRKKLDIIKSEIKKIDNDNFYYYMKYLLSEKVFRLSFSTLYYNFRGYPRDYHYLKKNKNESYSKGSALKNIKNSSFFNHYTIDKKLVNKSINLLSKNDIIIIPPVIFEHYLGLHKCGALAKYFSTIEDILNKDVKVISYLYSNKDLLNYDLFDTSGSHFKHYYAKKIIDDIFSEKQAISLTLTKDNFSEYKKSIVHWLQEQESSQNAF